MTDRDFMTLALEQAKLSADELEVPVGAVIVRHGEVVAIGRNRREKSRNAIAHAEIEAIDGACKALGGWRLWECEMFVTLEPCPMCAGAVINSRLKRLVYGAPDPKAGSCGSVVNLFDLPYNHKPQVVSGVMQAECSAMLSDFFTLLRGNKKQTD